MIARIIKMKKDIGIKLKKLLSRKKRECYRLR